MIIYRFQPFACDKELGREYNGHCSLVPNDDNWIMILDWDCYILDISSYHVIDKAIEKYPETEIFGAYTNRVGYNWQLGPDNNKIYEQSLNYDMAFHKKLAKAYASKRADGSCLPIPTVAGFFMLFRKKYWKQNPFQEKIMTDRGRTFDKQFCKGATDMKVIQGLYVFHQYRMDKDILDRSHLK